MSTVGTEGCEIDVPPACTGERSAPEVQGAGKRPGGDHVSRAVRRDGFGVLAGRIAESLAPEMVPGGVELREIGVRAAGAGQRPAAEVRRPVEQSRHDDVACVVRREMDAALVEAVAEVPAPEVVPVGIELGEIGI